MSVVIVWPQEAVSVPSLLSRPLSQVGDPRQCAQSPRSPGTPLLGQREGAGRPGTLQTDAGQDSMSLFTSPRGRASSLSLSYLFL